MVLIDGNHNWYTVFEELRLVERQSARWPLTLLHDIAWPYGRRDMYDTPTAVPAQHRHPHRKAGVLRGQSKLAARSGLNAGCYDAEHEGGARNGVLTAIEDFIDSSPVELELFAVPGPGGLGLLIDGPRLGTDAAISAVVREAHDMKFAVEVSPRYASRYFDMTEDDT